MSLSSWFRDYVYIPLGGNRVSKIKWLRNIFIVWFLTGLWHGADWNFILWGLYFGIILSLEKLFLLKILDKTPKILRHIYVLFIVMISFVLFSATSLEVAVTKIQSLFGIGNIPLVSSESIYYLQSYIVIFIISLFASTELPKKIIYSLKNKNEGLVNILEILFIFILLWISVSYIIDGSFNPFLYFRF